MSEPESFLIDKQNYIKLKKLADKNECSANEEIGKAVTAKFEDINESSLDEIDLLPRKDRIFLILPEDIYNLFQEQAENNSTEIEEEFNQFLEAHLSESGDEDGSVDESGNDEDSEDEDPNGEDSENEEAAAEPEEEEESSDEADNEEEEKPKHKKQTEEKGLFDTLTEAVEEMVEDYVKGMISGDEDDEDDDKPKKKHKNH